MDFNPPAFSINSSKPMMNTLVMPRGIFGPECFSQLNRSFKHSRSFHLKQSEVTSDVLQEHILVGWLPSFIQ
jgi:hypothetical protein